jgi:hypothetical protein
MAYTLQALIGDEFVIRTAVPSDGVVVRLPQGKAMVPLSERMRQNHDIPFLPLTDEGVAGVPESIAFVVESMARSGKVAYVEAEFFGGTGTQACVTWDVTGQVSQPVVDDSAINAALKFLGVRKEHHQDEFDALGLGRCRATEEWEQLPKHHEEGI